MRMLRCVVAGVRKQSCTMRRCVRMTSNSSTSSGSSKATSKHGSDRGEVHPSDPAKGSTFGAPDGPRTFEEQSLFWAAVSGCMALTGQPAGSGEDDEDTAIVPPHGYGGSRDSGSSSPHSPAHSSDSGGGTDQTYSGHKRMLQDMVGGGYGGGYSGYGGGGHLGYDLPRQRPSWTGAGGLPGGAFTGQSSFCCKLATLLVRDSPSTIAPPSSCAACLDAPPTSSPHPLTRALPFLIPMAGARQAAGCPADRPARIAARRRH